jgi:ABC-type multidrug transport system ATPase subunit
VLFVSHNLDAVRKLCRSAVIIREGQLAFRGSVEGALERYLSSGTNPIAARTFDRSPSIPKTPFFQGARTGVRWFEEQGAVCDCGA